MGVVFQSADGNNKRNLPLGSIGNLIIKHINKIHTAFSFWEIPTVGLWGFS